VRSACRCDALCASNGLAAGQKAASAETERRRKLIADRKISKSGLIDDHLEEEAIARLVELEVDAVESSGTLKGISVDHPYGLLKKDRRKTQLEERERIAQQTRADEQMKRQTERGKESFLLHRYVEEIDPETGLPLDLGKVLDGSAFSRSKYESSRELLSQRTEMLFGNEIGLPQMGTAQISQSVGLQMKPAGMLKQWNLYEQAGVHVPGHASSKSPHGERRTSRSRPEADGAQRFFGPRGEREERIEREKEYLRRYGTVLPNR
jgi:hypothetical protein